MSKTVNVNVNKNSDILIDNNCDNLYKLIEETKIDTQNVKKKPPKLQRQRAFSSDNDLLNDRPRLFPPLDTHREWKSENNLCKN
jgi:hypothetical protein